MKLPDTKNSSSIIRIDDINRLSWACRRGMLELDVLLKNFLNEAYSNLTEYEQKQFIKLLACEDPLIFAWIMGHEIPPESDMLMITKRIRTHAQSRV